MIIKKIFEKDFDDETHREFLKFSRGEFNDKYLIEAKKQAKKWKIKTSQELANFLVKECLEKLKQDGVEKIQIKGAIISTLDLKKECEDIGINVEKEKKFMGIKQLIINQDVEVDEILKLIESNPKVFYALSFSGSDFNLKIKAKPPKSSKPSSKGEKKPVAGFCSLTIENTEKNKDIINKIFFDIEENRVENSSEINISHNIHIEKIIYPENVSELKPAEIREQSKRQGKLVRIIEINSNSEQKQADFTV